MSQGNNPTSPGNNPFGGPQQQEYQDYLNRFQQGPQAVSEGEAAARYRQVAPQLPPDVYQQSAQDVFAQLTPEQRMQLGQQLIQSARQGGQAFPDVNGDGIDDRLQYPNFLAQKATQVQQQQPGLLGQLLGGGAAGSALGSAGRVPGASITGGGAGGMLSSPLAKGILGGIAGAGLMRMLGGGGHHYGGGGLFGAPMMGGYFGGGPVFGGGGFGMGGEMYEEGYEEGLEDTMEGDFGGDFGGGDFGE